MSVTYDYVLHPIPRNIPEHQQKSACVLFPVKYIFDHTALGICEIQYQYCNEKYFLQLIITAYISFRSALILVKYLFIPLQTIYFNILK